MSLAIIWQSILILFVFAGFVAFILFKHKSPRNLGIVSMWMLTLALFFITIRFAQTASFAFTDFVASSASILMQIIGVVLAVTFSAMLLTALSSLLIVSSSYLIPSSKVLDVLIPIYAIISLILFVGFWAYTLVNLSYEWVFTLTSTTGVTAILSASIPLITWLLVYNWRQKSKCL